MSLQLTGINNKRKGFADINEDGIYFASEDVGSKNQRIDGDDDDINDLAMFPEQYGENRSSSTAYRNIRWEHMFCVLVEWGMHFGTCNINRNTLASLDDGSEVLLGEWLKRQKRSKRKGELPLERLMLLQKLVDGGFMDWDRVIHAPVAESDLVLTDVVGMGDAGGPGSVSGCVTEGAPLGAISSLPPGLDINLVPDYLLGANASSLQELLVTVRGHIKESTGSELSSLVVSGAITVPTGAITGSGVMASRSSSGLAAADLGALVTSGSVIPQTRRAEATRGDTNIEVDPNVESITTSIRVDMVIDSETAILHSIATFPVPDSFRRVIEPKLHLRCFGVSVIPSEAEGSCGSAVVGHDPSLESSVQQVEYKFKKFWYCCAGRKCALRRKLYDVTDSCKAAGRHLRKVHKVYLNNFDSTLLSAFPVLCNKLASLQNMPGARSAATDSRVSAYSSSSSSHPVLPPDSLPMPSGANHAGTGTGTGSDVYSLSDDETAPGLAAPAGLRPQVGTSGSDELVVAPGECHWLAAAGASMGDTLPLQRALASFKWHSEGLLGIFRAQQVPQQLTEANVLLSQLGVDLKRINDEINR